VGVSEIQQVDYVVLLCRDLAQTTAFYRDVMAFRIEDDRATWVSFRVGATLLTLRPRGTTPVGEDGDAVPGSVAVQLAFRVPLSAVDACQTELLKHGVTIVREPTDVPAFRHRTLFFHDPEDNLIEIYAEY
jgi:catechol 2,3-dioxygenase-like lactoylglutathione lyase family enzyme